MKVITENNMDRNQKTSLRNTQFILSFLAIITVLVVASFFFVYSIIILDETGFRVIRTVDEFDKFPEFYMVKQGKIINKAGEGFIIPDDPLAYQITIQNPLDFDREVQYILTVKKGEYVEQFSGTFWLQEESERVYDINFYLKEEGRYDLSLLIVLDVEKSSEELQELLGLDDTIDHTFHVKNLQVSSLANKLLSDLIFSTSLPQIVLVGTTILLVVVTYRNMKKTSRHTEEELKLTRKEINSRLKADCEVLVANTDLKKNGKKAEGILKIRIRNGGTIPANNIQVHFKDPTSSLEIDQLIRDEDEIKKSSMPVKGSILPGLVSPEILHKTCLDEPKVYQVAIWVTYDFADVKNMEIIQIVEINVQSHTEPILFTKLDIENEKKRQKNQGL